MDQTDLKSRIRELYEALRSTKWPLGAVDLPGIGDADVDLAELDGFVAGLASSYLQRAPIRVDRIPLSRSLAAVFTRSLPSEEQDRVLEPYRRRWQLLVELSELLAKTGKVRVEWTD